MSDIEETVSLLETMIDWQHLDGCEPQVCLLIADWRKRGEALGRLRTIIEDGSINDDLYGTETSKAISVISAALTPHPKP